MKLPGILNTARLVGSFAADKNPKVAVFGNSIANQFSAISNRSGCIGRGAGRMIAQDLKQFNAMSNSCIGRSAGRMIARDLKQFNAMSNGRIDLVIAQDLKPQQSQQKQVQFAAALTHVGLSPSQTAHHSNKL
ncbi:hypothetical protein [Yersinia mollaretii]|uniref:Uncharacterized protein n=1 Tax=Yersinia mollaretii TaxID=33060 RepID=A0AA36LP00_YERMO|nr:hypothetical protein [Yersinia mollaretii]CNI40462.1 Uncharacterised protein [Yersinia mollaretii]